MEGRFLSTLYDVVIIFVSVTKVGGFEALRWQDLPPPITIASGLSEFTGNALVFAVLTRPSLDDIASNTARVACVTCLMCS